MLPAPAWPPSLACPAVLAVTYHRIAGGNCYADLYPDITVAVAFFSVRAPGDHEPFTVIRQRTRSDSPHPDLGQIMTWQLRWEHAPLIVDDARGNATEDITPITRHRAEQITSCTAHQCLPPDAAQRQSPGSGTFR